MTFDEWGLIIMEQNAPDDPGRLGDSCAETSRFAILRIFSGQAGIPDVRQFQTPKGYVRHPLSPWREDDISTDQLLPLYLSYRERFGAYAMEMRRRLRSSFYRLPNGQFITPAFFAELYNLQTLRVLFIFVQLLIFKLPYRWSDSKKWFEGTDGSSADYLNFIMVCLYAPKWVRRLIDKQKLIEKVEHYYRPEPNAFVVKWYKEILE